MFKSHLQVYLIHIHKQLTLKEMSVDISPFSDKIERELTRESMFNLLCMYIHIADGGSRDSIQCAADSVRLGGEINAFINKHVEDAKHNVTRFIHNISTPVQKRKYVRKNLNQELQQEGVNTIRIYCEGACVNIGTITARASIGIFAHITTDSDVFTREISQAICETDHQSNQRAELCAIYEGIKLAHELKNEFIDFDIQLVVSSMYAYRCMTDWGKNWAAKDWKGLIHHLDIIRPAFEVFDIPCNVIKKTDALPGFLRARSLVSQADC